MSRREAATVRARGHACALRAGAKLIVTLALFTAVLPPSARSFESGSASYSNKRSSLNSGGKRQTSSGSTYSNSFSAGEVAFTTHTSLTYQTRSGLQPIDYYPGRVTGLWSSSGTLSTAIDLQWTAPGNDGYAPGTSAGRYELRYSSIAALSPASSDTIFNAAASVTPAPPTPASQGATQSLTATGLLEGVTYYFAMKARERDGIPGVLSAGTTAQTNGPFGCAVVKNVCKSGNCGFTTIQAAVNAIPNPLIGHSCVIVRDSEVYGEQVTVQNFTNNGSSITITRGPEIAGRPLVAPPATSTAAFRIVNSSVNIFNLDVRPAAAVPYGIFSSSDYVKVSSVNVDSNGLIATAGIAVSSWSQVGYSSITVGSADGLRVVGSSTTVSYSTAAATSGSALHLNGANRVSVARGVFLSGTGRAAAFDSGAAYNTVSLSTLSATGALSSGLFLSAASSNTIINSYVAGSSAAVVSGSTGTMISASMLAATAVNGSGLGLTGGSVNLWLSSSVVSGGSLGAGIYLDAGNKGLIVVSTNTVRPTARYGVYAGNQVSGTQVWIASNTISPLVASGQDAYGLYLDGLTSGATIYNNSVVLRNSATMGTNTAYALFVQSGAALRIDNNRFSNPGVVTGGSYGGVLFAGTQSTSFKFNDLHSTGPVLTNSFLLQLAAGTTIQARNNIYASSMVVSGSSATLFLSANSGIDSDYNDFFSSNTVPYFVWGSTAARGLAAWQALGKDAFSISANPLWFNPGTEDFHPLSQGTGPGVGRCTDPPYCTTHTNDTASSLTIDSADPAEAFASEPAPNGGAANQGSFGNTVEASQSPPILSVVLSTGLYDFGSVDMNLYGSTVAVSSIIATNNGTITETFQLSAAVVTGGSVWQLGQVTGIETVKLQGLFNTAQPVASAFDVVASTITTGAQPSGNGTVNGNNYQGDQNGYQVPAQGKRSMWFKLTPPTSTIYNGVQQRIRVTVTAIP